MSRSPPSDGAGGDDHARDCPDVAGVVAHLFRREAGRLVAILAGRLGAEHLHLAEDVVQDALLRAMQVWPFSGVPENPSAWLLQTARNRAFDTLRRRRSLAGKVPQLAPLIEQSAHEALAVTSPQFEDEIADSQLRMMFVCCHPGLPADAQVALILKILCGFGEREIAAAFLASPDAIMKKLVRARRLLRDQHVAVDLPPAHALAPRVETVLHALYLLFNEGYKASEGSSLLRADLCAEAIRLGELLAAHGIGRRPEVEALLALMHLHAARLPARVGDDGSLLVLAVQDRSRWDQAQVRRGFRHLHASGTGPKATRWHLEAAIAACHALSPTYAETDWPRIAELYDTLRELAPSPIVELNRAIAVAQAEGADAGLQALATLPDRRALERYYLFHAVTGHLLLEAGRRSEAGAALARALDLAVLPAERQLLTRRLADCRKPR